MKGTTYIKLNPRILSLLKIYNTIWITYIFKNKASKSTNSILLKCYHYIAFTKGMTVFQFVSILQAILKGNAVFSKKILEGSFYIVP